MSGKVIFHEKEDNHIEIYGENYFGYFNKTRTCCRGIIINEGKILLSYETKTDQYMIPGGGLEEKESIEECVVRELSEETGYLVEPTKYVLRIEEHYEDEKYIDEYFLCKIVGTSIRKLTRRENEVGMEPRWVEIKKAISIFSKHQDYASEDEMRRGLYQREYIALNRIINNE